MDWLWFWILIAGIMLFFIIRRPRILRNQFRRLRERRRSRQLKIINHYRRKQGLKPLKAYYALDKIARTHSSYMAKHLTCNHAGSQHRAARVRKLTGSGYVGENCFKYPAHRYSTRIAIKLVKGWMKSPGHRANLMNPNYTKIGIGIVAKRGYVYATQIFTN